MSNYSFALTSTWMGLSLIGTLKPLLLRGNGPMFANVCENELQAIKIWEKIGKLEKFTTYHIRIEPAIIWSTNHALDHLAILL